MCKVNEDLTPLGTAGRQIQLSQNLKTLWIKFWRVFLHIMEKEEFIYNGQVVDKEFIALMEALIELR